MYEYIVCFSDKQENLAMFVHNNCRLLKSQSKVKELTREARNKDEEIEEYRRKLDSVKNERRRAEKNVQEVWPSLYRYCMLDIVQTSSVDISYSV